MSLGGLSIPGVEGAGDDYLVEFADELAKAGVSYLYGGVARAETRAEFVAEVGRMGETLVPRLAEIATPGL